MNASHNSPTEPVSGPAYSIGRIVTIGTALVVAAVVALLALSILITAVRTALWLTTDHPLVAVPAAMFGVVMVGRKL